MPRPNYGFLTEMANGIKEGLTAYMTMSNMKHQQQLQNLISGVEEGPDGLQFTPEEKQKRDQLRELQINQAQQGLLSSDSQSIQSKHARDLYKGLLGKAAPGTQGSITDDMSESELMREGSPLKAAITGGFGMQGQQMRAQSFADKNDIARDNQTSAAYDKVVNNKQLQNHVQRIQGANRIFDQLGEIKSGKMVDTNQFLNDLNAEYVALLTGSNNPALGKQERTEYRTYAGDLSNIIQKIKAEPQSVNSPAIMNQLETAVGSLKGSYQKNLATQANLLKREYAHNPAASAAQDRAIQELISNYGQTEQPQGLVGQGQGGAHPQDSAAVQWAKQNPNDPRAQKILQLNGAK